MAALLSMSLVACQSTDDATATTETAAPAAASTGAGNSDGLTAAQRAARDAALAKTKFYFEFDKSDLSQEDRDALIHHANQLKANPSMRIRLEGHADEQGTREYNLALGERRAQSVERYLQVQGVAANQMETVSYGEERPSDSGTTEAAYSANRRVEMVK
ncbi:MAG: peptidoglycan-associated lipoprotein Pal [Pseudomonadota bacterium]